MMTTTKTTATTTTIHQAFQSLEVGKLELDHEATKLPPIDSGTSCCGACHPGLSGDNQDSHPSLSSLLAATLLTDGPRSRYQESPPAIELGLEIVRTAEDSMANPSASEAPTRSAIDIPWIEVGSTGNS